MPLTFGIKLKIVKFTEHNVSCLDISPLKNLKNIFELVILVNLDKKFPVLSSQARLTEWELNHVSFCESKSIFKKESRYSL